ncbi:hypothetical protein [Nocardia sp. CDC160]|uniref:hypothetical protein n=1 Tax=Nocardia sp. CDC160 TaxID=3112166 RepID=UPI002DB7A33C|nr:hypothetical protein [Nocardia sp. CDC160]MEC3920319.1 hypothetical protein [Nocardia sp. CDC160]
MTLDGTVVDPTWRDAGVVYFVVAVADSTMIPSGGGGLLWDFDRSLPLLRDGSPTEAFANVGRQPRYNIGNCRELNRRSDQAGQRRIARSANGAPTSYDQDNPSSFGS